MRISTQIDFCEPSEDDDRLSIAKLDDICFCKPPAAIFTPLKGRKHDVSIQSLVDLSKTFLRISSARNIAQTWIFARLFDYSSSLLSLIIDLICLMVLTMVRQWKPAIASTLITQHRTWISYREWYGFRKRLIVSRKNWLGLVLLNVKPEYGESNRYKHFVVWNLKAIQSAETTFIPKLFLSAQNVKSMKQC